MLIRDLNFLEPFYPMGELNRASNTVIGKGLVHVSTDTNTFVTQNIAAAEASADAVGDMTFTNTSTRSSLRKTQTAVIGSAYANAYASASNENVSKRSQAKQYSSLVLAG